jgi:hypothetical protein
MPPQPQLSWAGINFALQHVAKEKSEWAGLPVPLDDPPLVLEPKFPYQFKVCKKSDLDESAPDTELVNRWYSEKLQCNVSLWRENGKLEACFEPCGRGADHLICTIGASVAWTLEAEFKALSKLREMVAEHTYKYYMLTGSFLETSRRSGVTYLFRKLRPTLAMRPGKGGKSMKLLCALCMHPIGYYQGSWGGCMVPTDDVLAHLCLMRGDEKRFWKQSNQHPAHHPQSGL